MLLREGGNIRWSGTFGVQTPLGRRLPWIRALVANRGPVCDDHQLWQAATEKLVEQMRQENFVYLDVFPEWSRPADVDHPLFMDDRDWHSTGSPRASLRLDLTASEDELFANFRKISRYEIRRTERSGAVVSTASSDAEIGEFLRIYERTATQKGFAPDPIDDVRRIIRWLISSDARGALLMARASGFVHGGAVIVRCGRRCWYIWGASDRDEQIAVGHILQWKALQWAKSHGCTEYDFGGYTPGATSGPAWFKEGFGGRVVHFVAPHRRVIDAKRYGVFRVISKIASGV